MSSFRVSGDLGDCIFQLALLHSLGGKHALYAVDRPGITAPFTSRFDLLKPLIDAQPYIESSECTEEEPDVDLVKFRRFHSAVTTLIAANCAEYHRKTGVYPDCDGSEPWLFVEPDKKFAGKIIIARSPRYNNPWFPWDEVVKHNEDRLLFVGIDKEYHSFCLSFGHVERLVVKDFLHLAQAIAGSGFFIGNQSSPHAVAMGLGVNIIQEVCLEQPDCIYDRSNVMYVDDGAASIPSETQKWVMLPSRLKKDIDLPKDICPPGFWQYPGLPPATHFNILRGHVAQLTECSIAEADIKLQKCNAERCPEFFKAHMNNPLALVEQASEKAKKKVALQIPNT